jgi:hypothetical protein
MDVALIDDSVEDNIVADLERGICAIFGVRGARVILDEVGEVREVHVVASPKRSPKKIVRDIETYFAVRHRRRIDYRRISCVQIGDDVPLQERPTLRRIACGAEECEVILSDGTHQLLGRASAADGPAKAGALATIAALNQLWGDEPRLSLLDQQILPLGQRELVLVYLIYQGRSIENHTGTSFVRGEPAESAARAVLAAVNRRLRSWITERAQPPAIAEGV